MGLPLECPVRLYDNKKAAIHIPENRVFFERTKHIKFDCFIVCKKFMEKMIMKKHISSYQQV